MEYKCFFCNKNYISKYCLERHLDSYCPNKCDVINDHVKLYKIFKCIIDNDVTCLFCNKIYVNKYILERHLINKCRIIVTKNTSEINQLIILLSKKMNIQNIKKIINKNDSKIVEYKKLLLNELKKFFSNKKNKVKDKEWRLKNKEKISVRIKEWGQNNQEKIQQYKEKIKCRKCRLFNSKKENNWLCSYCNPDKPEYIKKREVEVKLFLEKNNYQFDYNKICKYQDKWYFPDFRIKCLNFWIIIECDEKAHKDYCNKNEIERQNSICLGLNIPCVFSRFNPDKKNIKMETKQKVLKSYINYYLTKEKCYNEICYLFY